jgi:hypothetical protein
VRLDLTQTTVHFNKDAFGRPVFRYTSKNDQRPINIHNPQTIIWSMPDNAGSLTTTGLKTVSEHSQRLAQLRTLSDVASMLRSRPPLVTQQSLVPVNDTDSKKDEITRLAMAAILGKTFEGDSLNSNYGSGADDANDARTEENVRRIISHQVAVQVAAQNADSLASGSGKPLILAEVTAPGGPSSILQDNVVRLVKGTELCPRQLASESLLAELAFQIDEKRQAAYRMFGVTTSALGSSSAESKKQNSTTRTNKDKGGSASHMQIGVSGSGSGTTELRMLLSRIRKKLEGAATQLLHDAVAHVIPRLRKGDGLIESDLSKSGVSAFIERTRVVIRMPMRIDDIRTLMHEYNAVSDEAVTHVLREMYQIPMSYMKKPGQKRKTTNAPQEEKKDKKNKQPKAGGKTADDLS